MNGTYDREILLHEYTHLILRDGAELRIPRWVDEGFAEFMSTVRFIAGHVELGRMPSDRTHFIVNISDWVPLGELFSGAAFFSTDWFRRSRAYATAWIVMHYFQLGKRGEGDDLERYLDLVQQRTDPVAAATAAWQLELHELAAEFRTYARSRPHYVRIPDDVFDFSGISYTSSEMTVPATAEALARLCRRLGNSERARQLTAYGRSMQEHRD